MEIQKLHHDGVSVSEIARQLDMDRKTVRKYLKQAPGGYERKPKSWQVDPYRAYLRERWELGVHNASKLFVELGKRVYPSRLSSPSGLAGSMRTALQRGFPELGSVREVQKIQNVGLLDHVDRLAHRLPTLGQGEDPTLVPALQQAREEKAVNLPLQDRHAPACLLGFDFVKATFAWILNFTEGSVVRPTEVGREAPSVWRRR